MANWKACPATILPVLIIDLWSEVQEVRQRSVWVCVCAVCIVLAGGWRCESDQHLSGDVICSERWWPAPAVSLLPPYLLPSVRTEAQCVAPVGRRVRSPRNCGTGRPPPSDLPVRRSRRRSGAADGPSLAERGSLPTACQPESSAALHCPSVPEASGICPPMTSHQTHSLHGSCKRRSLGVWHNCWPAESHWAAERSMRQNFPHTQIWVHIMGGFRVNLLMIMTRWAQKTLLCTTTRQQDLPLQ